MDDVIKQFKEKFDRTKLPRSRIELHLHLDGSYRPSTVWEIAQEKGIDLKVKSLEELIDVLTVKEPSSLAEVLARFDLFAPVFIGDLKALERASYEICEDQAKEGVIYFETRFSPHLLSSVHGLPDGNSLASNNGEEVTPDMVVQTILKGLDRGEKAFNIKARAILCCMRHMPQWNEEVLELCQKYKGKGVVAMDIAGNEGSGDQLHTMNRSMESVADDDIAIFQKAARLHIHRTVHAGEGGPATNVRIAIDDMKTERVGHGYRVLQDEEIYEYAKAKGVHFETCPYSSLMTAAVTPSTFKKHPIVRFAEDGVNFSVNKDDSLLTHTTLDGEYDILKEMGLTEVHFIRSNFNAARASFLPDEEKQELIDKLRDAYGVNEF